MALVACALALGACARERRPDEPWAPAFASDDPGLDPLSAEVWDGKTGAPLALDDVRARLAAADVVLVGEEHADPDFHATQLEVAALASGLGFRTVGVEWVRWSMRAALRAAFAEADDRFLERVYRDLRWDETWGHAFSAYAPIFAWCRRAGVVMEPLNARPEISRAVAMGTVDRLEPELRAEVPALDTGTDAHRAWFRAAMAAAGGHGHGHGHGGALDDATLERFYLAQLVWDETMARHVRELASGGRKVVVFAGVGHVERALGIAARLGDLRYVIVRPVADAADARARAKDAPFPDRVADLLWAYPRRTNTASR